MKKAKRLLSLVLVFSLLLALLVAIPAKAHEIPEDEYNTVYLAVRDYGVITIELYPNEAPITVANFKDLVWHNFYDGLTFHRIIEDFMIQGGDPLGTGTGGSSNKIKGEFSLNNVETGLKHVAGTISMARSGHPNEAYFGPDAIPFEEREPYYNSASSQFFIVTQTSPQNTTRLDGKYAAFGQVKEGLDIVQKIAAVETGTNDKPVKPVVIADITFNKAEAEAALLKADGGTASGEKASLTWLWITLASVGIVGAIVLFSVLPVIKEHRREQALAAEREEKRKAAAEAAKNKHARKK